MKDICTIHAFDLVAISYPYTALYAWHVQVNYKILTGEPSVVKGTTYMAAMLGPRRPSVAATLGPGGTDLGDRLWGDHRWHDSA